MPPFSIRLLRSAVYDPTDASEPTDTQLRSLLPASYRIADNLVRPKLDDLTYLEKELGVGRLNALVEWLWVAGRPMPPRALHHQLLLGRDVVITEQMDLHLVWAPGRIFLKPLPPFLLEPRFWRDQLACKPRCDCSYEPSPRGHVRECARRKLWRWLLCYESDFWIAKEKYLLPQQIEWMAWRDFIEELDTEHIYAKIDTRFLYGELRLGRLNILYRLSQGAVLRGYLSHWQQYGDFFHDNFGWLASTTVYIAIVLTAMQTSPANHDCYGSIIAIHGLDTESPRTWEFDTKKDGSRVVNWLQDSDMLPAAVPDARIYTYDWNAKVFDNAPVQTLLNHADNLLSLIAVERSTSGRPIIFIASCFGGLVLAEAICRAAQEGSKYRQVLRFTVGIVFLATPFFGTDAARPASWLVVVKGIMGKDASDQLIKDLEARHAFVCERVQKFAEIANDNAIRLPIWCFFETKKTKIAKKILPTWISDNWSRGSILVTQSSACLHGFDRRSLGKAHVMMNKFEGKDCPDFIQVKEAIQFILKEAPNTLKRREKDVKKPHFIVPFGCNKNFVGRESILQQLLGRIPPSANQDDCQRTALEGLGGIGKTQIALEAAYQVRDKHPDCSVFWVPAVDATSFENAYRDIGNQLGVKGMEDDKADVKVLVRAALGHESAGSWLMIVDNADDLKLFADATLSDYLPFNRNGSILFTTRNHEAAARLDIPQQDITNVTRMNNDEATNLLRAGLKEDQIRDAESITYLLGFLANLPLAIKQASAYMAKTGMSTSKYLQHCQSSDKTMVRLLSQDFEDRNRYKNINNPIATTWLISFNHISRDYPLAARYLRFICYLAEKDVPISLLPPGEDELEADEAIGILKGYAFVIERNEPDSFDIHRLVRLAMRNWLQTNGEWQEWAMDAIQHLTDEYPFPNHENRSIWMRYLPHGRAVLHLRNEFADKETDLLFNYNEAEQMYRKTLELRERVLGREHPSTLASINNLALAEQMHRQTLELRERVLGREHPSTLDSMNNLANVLDSQGKYEELTERVLGREYLDTLGSMNNLALLIKRVMNNLVSVKEHLFIFGSINNLANVLNSQGKYKELREQVMNALAITLNSQGKYEGAEQVLGREHPFTLGSMNNLASIHRQILELTERVLGREHLYTFDSMNNLANMHRQTLELRERVMNNLANVLNSQGKYEELTKRVLGREHLNILNSMNNLANVDREHSSTFDSMNNLANILDSQGKYEELTKRVLGREHPNTFGNINNLALILELIERVLGREHPDTLGNINNLANMHQQTLELKERVLGREHPDILGSMNNLTLELKERVLGREHSFTLVSMNNLAEAKQMHQQTLELTNKANLDACLKAKMDKGEFIDKYETY
ncbi:hypothetical protein GGR52DRAFT_582588 [Hypoxylon sp. FL1284]|nr:hypothetical protein GGR52DRAFT_582588 [Hypoxylon sp. FL1284]